MNNLKHNLSIGRVEWVDVLKGLGIILVVLGHTTILSSSLVSYIFTFHMPLFFFISGYLFSIDRYPKLSFFVVTKIKSILVPYVLLSIISVISFFLITGAPIDAKQVVYQFFVSTRNQTYFNGALWFLTALFLVEVIFYLLQKFLKNDLLLLVATFILGTIGVVYFNTLSVPKLPWSFDSAMYYIVFYWIGNVFNRYNFISSAAYKYLLYLSILMNIFELIKPDKFSRVFNLIPNSMIYYFFLSIFTAMVGIIAFMGIAQRMSKSKNLAELGKNSLIIFGLHLPIAFSVLNGVMVILKLQTTQNNLFAFVYTLAALVILKPFVYGINTYFPFVTGKFKNNKVVHQVDPDLVLKV